MAFDEQRLLDAIRAIDGARSLSEILDTLGINAGQHATRVAILLVRGDALRGWGFAGFEGPEQDAPPNVEVPLDAGAGVLGEAVRTGAAVSSTAAGGLTMAPFGLAEGRHRLALPISMSGQVVAVLYADVGAEDDPQRERSAGWSATLEVMTRHAARCLEALTAFAAARALTGQVDADSSAAAAPAGGPGEAPEPHNDEEEGARRFARLLVSEIKLYHEAAVLAGQRERDLATRLADEIARARRLYEDRVPAPVRRLTDHFHAELVRTLANGDAGLLGLSEVGT